MKKILVLGIGNAQTDLLKYLKGRFFIYACADSPEAPGFSLCDQFQHIDITDKEKALSFCRQQTIDYIYSIGSEAAMPTISWVSRELKLPRFVSYETALTCYQKNRLRDQLKSVYGHVDHQIMASGSEPLHLAYPVIVKPADGQGQRGISLVSDPESFEQAYQNALQYSHNGLVVAEEYIDGPEISVNVFMVDKTVHTAILSSRISWPEFPGGLIHKHLFPCAISRRGRDNVLKLVMAVASALEIDNGPAYFQIKMQGDHPKLIEVTPRLDGCHLWRVIRYAAGIDLLDLSIRRLVGGESEGTASQSMLGSRPDYDKGQWILEFFCAPPGTIYNPENYQSHPNSTYVEHYYKAGQVVKRINGYMEKCGYQIYRS
jgi:formate-dependent phosphoribosylglycinamide formyltransferase (GAR transformylase)